MACHPGPVPAPDPDVPDVPVTDSARRVGRFAGLDGLRGLAAFVVLVHHALLVHPGLAQAYRDHPGHLSGAVTALSFTPLHLVWAGTEAVLVFFVLSGFVLGVGPLTAERRQQLRDWVEYYPRRAARLYLPVAGALVLALLQARWLREDHALPGASWVYNVQVGTGTLHNLLRDVTLAHGHATFLDGPLWSLHWEVLFSLALPAYLLLGRVRWSPVVAAALLGVSAWGAASHHDAALYLPVFGLGVLVAGDLERARRVARSAPRALLLLSGLLLTATWSLRGLHADHHLGDRVLGVGVALTSLGALLLVLAFLDGPLAEWAGGSRVVRWLGRRSFSLYLVHAPVVISVAFLLGGRPSIPLLVLLAVPLSLVVAELFGRYVEEPAHRFSRRLGAAAVQAMRSRGAGDEHTSATV